MKSDCDRLFYSQQLARTKPEEMASPIRLEERALGYVASSADSSFFWANSSQGLSILGQGLFSGNLLSLNGSYAYICHDAERNDVHVVTDRIGTIPIYYAMGNGFFACGTDWAHVSKACDLKTLSEDGVSQILLFGYCLGERTVVQGLNQCLPGTHYIFHLSTDASVTPIVERKCYWRFVHVNSISEYSHFHSAMDEVMAHIEQRYTELAVKSGSGVLVKLSGGYDSRLIAAIFSKHIPISCAVYGYRLSSDVVLSRIVSDNLGVPHKVCQLKGNELVNGERTRDVSSCIGARSLSYIAMGSNVIVSSLGINQITHIPGHALDFIAGSHVRGTDLSIASLTSAIDETIRRHCLLSHMRRLSLGDLSGAFCQFDSVYSEIRAVFREMENEGNEYCWMLQRFNLENRQSHHILSDADYLRRYGTVLLPWWDSEVVDLFGSCSLELLLHRNACTRYLRSASFTLKDNSQIARIPCSHLTFGFLLSGIKAKFIPEYACAIALSRVLGTREWERHSRRYVLNVPKVKLDSLIRNMMRDVPIVGALLTDQGLDMVRTRIEWAFLDALVTLRHVQNHIV